MKLDSIGIKFIQDEEGLKQILSDGRIQSYNLDKWTIGYGNTYFEDGTPVKRGDIITRSKAESLFKVKLAEFENRVREIVGITKLNQNQFNALVSYCYNRGHQRFANTKLVDMIIANPNDPKIRTQFEIEWGTNTKYKSSLIKRRKREADLYFSAPTATQNASGTLFLVLLGIGFLISK